MPKGMAKSAWDKEPCGCVKSELSQYGSVVIRCKQHLGKPTKKGHRALCYFDEGGQVRPEGYTEIQREAHPVDLRTERVYFARLGNLIKIGVSVDPLNRVRSFNAGLIGSVEGGRELEKQLHIEFADLRERGEWFKAKKRLLARIEELLL